MGYKVDFITVVFFHDFFNGGFDGGPVILNGTPGFLMTIVDQGAVLYQFFWYPAPIVKILQIPETDSVEQH